MPFSLSIPGCWPEIAGCRCRLAREGEAVVVAAKFAGAANPLTSGPRLAVRNNVKPFGNT